MFFVFLKIVKNSFYFYLLWNGNKLSFYYISRVWMNLGILEWSDYLFSFQCLVTRIGNGKIKKLTIIPLCI